MLKLRLIVWPGCWSERALGTQRTPQQRLRFCHLCGMHIILCMLLIWNHRGSNVDNEDNVQVGSRRLVWQQWQAFNYDYRWAYCRPCWLMLFYRIFLFSLTYFLVSLLVGKTILPYYYVNTFTFLVPRGCGLRLYRAVFWYPTTSSLWHLSLIIRDWLT